MSEEDYERAIDYLDKKLSMPREERVRWLNGIVDAWIAGRRALKKIKGSRE